MKITYSYFRLVINIYKGAFGFIQLFLLEARTFIPSQLFYSNYNI